MPYTVVVQSSFSALHHVRLPDGMAESPHRHDWVVRASFARQELDALGMVMDFEHARGVLDTILSELGGADLNECAALAGANPTAEVVARHIFDALAAGGLTCVDAVAVTEAPGCVAVYAHKAQPQCRSMAVFDDATGDS